jgi:hypothetical protein
MNVNAFNGRAMAQAVSRRPLTAEARIRARVNPCGICGGHSGTGTGFSPSSSVFTGQCIIPPSLSKFISSGGWTICPLVAAVQRRLTPNNQSISQSTVSRHQECRVTGTCSCYHSICQLNTQCSRRYKVLRCFFMLLPVFPGQVSLTLTMFTCQWRVPLTSFSGEPSYVVHCLVLAFQEELAELRTHSVWSYRRCV